MAREPILVIDDHEINLRLVRVLLEGEDYAVEVARDADEALAVLREFHPLLILMDIQLPGMDGLSLTKMLKADSATRDIIIVGLTAFAMKGDEERILAAGCNGYLTKPIDTRSLPAMIATYLRPQAAG